MEVPVINRFSGLESGMSSLPNPTFLSQIFSSFSGVEIFIQSFDFWKWSAVIIAVVATFSGFISRVKILFVVFRRQRCVLRDFEESDDDFSVDDTASSVSSSWSDYDEDEEPASTSRSWDSSDQDFHVRGSDYYINDHESKGKLRFRRRGSFQNHDGNDNQFSWTDFSGGKSVVKLWDSLRLEFDHRQTDENEIRVFDKTKDQQISSIFSEKSEVPSASKSAVVFSTAEEVFGKMSLNLWDTRAGPQIPALIAEWKPLFSGKVVGVNFAGDQKVYIRDEDARKITVGDVRNVRSPLENLTAADVETWWDADAVLVPSSSAE